MHLGQHALVATAIIGSGVEVQLGDGRGREELNASELLVEGRREGRCVWVAKGIGDSILITFSEKLESSTLAGPALGVGLVVRAHC